MSKQISETQLFEMIVGLEFCEETERVGARITEDSWFIGSQTQDAIDRLRSVKSAIVRGEVNTPYADFIMAFDVMRVYAQMAMRFGVASRTVRDYYAVYAYYTDEQREKYAVLPFSHFRFAKTCGIKISEQILALSLLAMDKNGGRPPSVDWLEVNLWRVTGDEQKIDEAEDVLQFDSIASSIATSDFSHEDNTGPVPMPVYYFVHSLQSVLERLRERLPQVEFDSELLDDITDLVNGTIEIAEKIRAAILVRNQEE